jgi:formylglycine-generating enzyme required for sulfatase activity
MVRYLIVFITFIVLPVVGILLYLKTDIAPNQRKGVGDSTLSTTINDSTNDNLSRVALVMGNGNYHNANIGKYPFDSLRNPVNDATDMAKALDDLGFEVFLKTDVKTRTAMEAAIVAFWERLRETASADVGLFYFSGHGFQYNNTNYLVPAEAAIANRLNIKSKALETDYILEHLEDANSQGVNLMILDACRDTIPAKFFDDRKNKGLFAENLLKGGFANMKAPVGSLIAYSTAPNTTSWGGLPSERNSVYTKHLLTGLRKKPYLNVTHLLMNVRRGVIAETTDDGKQNPWEHTSLTSPFCFKPPCMSESEYQLRLKMADLNPEASAQEIAGLKAALERQKEAQRIAELQRQAEAQRIAKLKRETQLQQQALLQQIADLKKQQADSEQQRQRGKTEISSLLRQCETYFQANYLTTNPASTENTAFVCYKKVLQKDKENAEALAGLKQITARYVELTEKALGNRQWDKAKTYLARLRQVNPESPKLITLTAQLENINGTAGKVFRDRLKDGSLAPEMVWIPAGTFRMGDIQGGGGSDEKPVHRVSMKKFAMGRYEVTVGEYLRFVRATDSHAPEWQEAGSQYNIQTGTSSHYKNLGSALTKKDHPIVGVSWNDATAYTKWLSQQTGQTYRLPTEAEWEYAARAGSDTKYWWGNGIGSNKANCDSDCGDNFKYTAPVGSFAANAFGLYDTAGNVWEWSCSEYENSYKGKEKHCLSKNRAKSDSLFVLRGGSWGSIAGRTRSAIRVRWSRASRGRDHGFRLARIL